MGKAISAQIGGEFFASKEQIETRIRNLAKSYLIMGLVEGSDLAFCLELFKFHPDYMRKSSGGIEAVQVRLDVYGNRCLHLIRPNGENEEISWTKCVRALK